MIAATETRRVPTRLGELAVRIVGDGPPAVLWPSMFVDGTTFDRMLPLLAGSRRCVVVDGPGLGDSEPLRRRSSITEAAGAALDLLDHLDLRQVDWVGNAFGGHVGYELAGRGGPLRTFAAISAPVEPVPPALRRQIRLLGPVLRIFGPVGPVRSAILGALLTEASAADPELRNLVLDSVRRPDRRSLGLALRSFVVDRVDVTGLLDRIAVPALFVATDDRGDWSPAAAQASADRTPSATAVVVSGARTVVPLEQPARLAAVLTDFWAANGGR
jgi:pimeloyl-ACP methyl ester carboxylesterase